MKGFLLKVVEGGLKGEEYLLDQEGLCLVGRDKSCSISIPRDKDIGLSRRHCLLIIDPPNLRVRDLFSTNGTYVNGHRLIPAPIGDTPESENPNDRYLLDGDRVSISNTVMEMHVLAEVEVTQETSKVSFENPLQDSQTTKTKVIDFSHGKTRENSLIPEPNSIDSNDPQNGIMEETQFFLSMPITESIPRPNMAIKQSESMPDSSNDEENEDSPGNTSKTRDTAKNRGNKMAEKPDMSIIMGNTDTQDKKLSADPPPAVTNTFEEEENSVNQSLEEIPSESTEPEAVSEEKPVPHFLVKKEDPKAEIEAGNRVASAVEERIPSVMPSVPEEKPSSAPFSPPSSPNLVSTNSVENEENLSEEVVEEKELIPAPISPDPVIEKSQETEKAAPPKTVASSPEKPEEKDAVPEPGPEKVKKVGGRKPLFDSSKMKAMEDLAGTLAHDYNKQLTVVMGYTELLKNAKDPVKIQEYADTIFRSAQLSSELTQQLLMFASHDHDHDKVGTSVNLSEMLTEIVSVMKHTSGRNIAVNFTPQSENKSLYTIGKQLEIHDALLNIAFNSIDAISGTGTLSFKIEPVALSSDDASKFAFDVEPGDFVKITIRDTGSGISDDNFERIFEPFFTTKQKDQALGMGLTVAYGVVKNHNGAIDVESQPGKGTTFEIFFPSSEKSNGKLADKVNAREKLAEIEATVLLLNDEQNMRSLIIEMLTLFKIKVKECADPKDVVTEYKKDPKEIDMVIVDMNIPEKGEMDIYKELRESNKDVKILFSSGYKPSVQSQCEMASGNVEILPKPYSADELYEAVYELLK